MWKIYTTIHTKVIIFVCLFGKWFLGYDLYQFSFSPGYGGLFNLFLLLLKKSAFYRNCLQHWVLCSNAAAIVKCEAVSVKRDCADEKAKLSHERKK